MNTYENAVQVDSLCKSFSDFQLSDVSFTLPRGTIMGLIGENGAGKSTTIKLLLSLLHKDSGSIQLFDQPLEHDGYELRLRIGSVLDEGFFYEDLTPGQMAKVLSHCHPRWDSDHFDALLRRFQLDPSKKFKEMSRGMKVKTKLAIALAPHPQLLLLDEPTSDWILWLVLSFLTCFRNSYRTKTVPYCYLPTSRPIWNAWLTTSPTSIRERSCYRKKPRSF